MTSGALDLPVKTATSSNTRALLIFTGYITINISLAFLIARSIVNAYVRSPSSYRQSRRYASILVFTNLALLSLSVTWYYMTSFFALSYQSWALTNNVTLPESSLFEMGPTLWFSQVHLGSWLKDVQLFREAWETVVETPGRRCWSLPIFFFTTGWSFYIAQEAPKRRIKHAWAYMILGQLVAISVAMNLFYLAVLVHPDPVSSRTVPSKSENTASRTKSHDEKQASSSLWTPPQRIYFFLRLLTFSSVLLVITSAGEKLFLLYLSLPHLLLIVPPVLPKVMSKKYWTAQPNSSAYDAFYSHEIDKVSLAGLTFVSVFSTVALWPTMQGNIGRGQEHEHRHSNAYAYPWQADVLSMSETPIQSLMRSLQDHPAVSSVGWDSLLCLISVMTWKVTGSRLPC